MVFFDKILLATQLWKQSKAEIYMVIKVTQSPFPSASSITSRRVTRKIILHPLHKLKVNKKLAMGLKEHGVVS